ncbi:MFS transporter [Camelliibacillus cellulosilyticus]|uniref:MFS transporter n=1 Tax=Camelliibacillus cellulosilyticus TaxID=2174486 RepID=A0ABV9GLB9_9BACL
MIKMKATNHRSRKMILVFLFFAIGISSLGDFIYLIALNISVLARTHSAASVSILWAIPPIAAILTRFWAGSVVDRLDRKAVLVFMDFFRGILVLILPFLPSMVGIYAIVFMLSCADVFYKTAFGPYFTKLIPPEKRKRTNSLMGMMQTGAIVVGPAIAGALLAFSSPGVALAANGISFLLSGLAFLLFLPKLLMPSTDEQTTIHSGLMQTVKTDWKIVFQFVKSNRYFIALYLFVQMTFIIGMALDSQEVVFAEQVLNLDSSGYSFLVTICGVGYLLGAVFVALFARHLPLRILIGMTFMTGIGFLIYALSGEFWMAALGFIILGFFQSCASTGFQTFYQNHVPIDKMGRIGSVLGLLQSIGIVLLTLLAGVFSNTFGVKGMVVGGVAIELLFCILLLAALFLPSKIHYFSEAHEAQRLQNL